MTNLKLMINKNYGSFIVLVVSFIFFRIIYIIKHKKKIILKEELMLLFFIIYLLILANIVTYNINDYNLNNYIPFKEITRYEIDSRLFLKNILGNILLFIPIGMFLKNYFKTNLLFTILVAFLYSFGIESIQLLIGRVFDVDDIILNLIGSIIGYYFSLLTV